MHTIRLQLSSLALLLAALPASCHRGGDGPEAAAPAPLNRQGDRIEVPAASPLRERLRIEVVRPQSVRRSLLAPAEVEADPARLARITPPLPGRVVQLQVRFGDTVTAGQPLLAIDSPDLVAAQTDYLKAKSALAQAERTLVRQDDLTAHGIGARREFEQAQTDRDLSRSELERAALRLKLLGIDLGSLGRPLTVRSPIAGRVVEFKVAPGEYKSELSQELMTIADLSTVWVTASVPEKDIRRVHKDEDASASFTAYPGERWTGKVLFVGDLLKPETRTIQVRVAFANKDQRLKPGMFGVVTFTETAAAELVVPTKAVVLMGDASFVFVEVAPFTFQRRRVTPAAQIEGLTVVADGVRDGERVVTDNAVLLPMINRLVRAALERRWLVLAVVLLLGVLGYLSWRELAVEAYPDIADTTAQVITQYPGHAAEEVEEQVTVPIERELNGTPGLQVMRSRSTFGLSLITLVFRDGIDDYFARQRIRERLEGVELPPGAQPGLDPLTSPIGEIFRYTLESASRSQRELRELQRWIVVPTLRQVPGVADVTNFGGETTQFQLLLDPARLTQYHLSLAQVTEAIGQNNSNAGGSVMVRGDQGFVVRGIGLLRNLDDLGNVVVAEQKGTPVFLRSLGTLQLGALARNGILGKDRNPDGVSGIVLLLRGENPSRVLDGLHERVRALNQRLLPPDVRVVPYLDRTDLVDTTLRTVSRTLLEGIALVVLVLILFLGDLRSALLVATTIPLSLLLAFILMRLTDIPANLLSLGAIDFGIIVDGAIVLMEAILRRREARPEALLTEDDAAGAAVEVARPIFFAKVIVITAYLPLFAFQRVEKRLFTPMAYTVGYALAAALLLALVLIPGLSLSALRKPRRLWENPLLHRAEGGYRRALSRLLARPGLALWPGAGAALLAVLLGVFIGKGFLPELDEGSLWLQVQLPPGLSLDKANEMAGELRQAVLESKEVSYIVTQLGRNDDGTDSWTPSHIEKTVGLVPYDRWPHGKVKADLVTELSARLGRIPGLVVGFSQPMIDGVNDKIAGAHSDLVIKLFGDDLGEARRLALAMVESLRRVPGSADVAVDQEPPLPQLQVRVDRAAAARFGINVSDIAALIEIAIGGKAIAQVFQGERRYDIAVRFIPSVRSSPDAIGDLTLSTPGGARIPLSQVARLELRSGESTITRETNRRHLTVRLNLRGRDLSGFLEEAQARIAREVPTPPGYELRWGGQFENQQRAATRLALILPLVLALIFVLLYGAFGVVRHAALILANVPLALLGGMVALWLRGMTLNVSSAVGFITLFGVAVQNGVILVSGLERLRRDGLPLEEAVVRGATGRLRAVLLTATVAALGMLPAALARGIGSDVQRPLATVVVGGLLSATLLTLFVLPSLYLVIERRVEHRAAPYSGEAL